MIFMPKIIEMHRKFGLDDGVETPHHLTPDERHFRIVAMQEELDEFAEATTLADALDALVDLQVFLFGTVYRMGMADIYDEAFNRVMNANLAKVLAGDATQSKRGFKRDLIKPTGWQAPNLKDLVNE